jgi:hypothetical protein
MTKSSCAITAAVWAKSSTMHPASTMREPQATSSSSPAASPFYKL